MTPETALFLDFDGTLSPLQDDPQAVELPTGGAAVLTRLAQCLGGALALVSGRDVRDLAQRVPASVWRAGNHGDMIMAPFAAAPDVVHAAPEDLLDDVRALVARLDGVRLEEKARVLAVHTRLCPQHEAAVAEGLTAIISQRSDYRLQRGKDIAELKPVGVHKGQAIADLMALDAFRGRRPLFLGDDTTDEDGFRTCLELNGSAIKIGEGPTIAPYRLADIAAVWNFLEEALDDLA